MMETPTDIVPKYYRMNPKIEDVLPDASHLTEGMIVLLADPDCRETVKDDMEDWRENRVLNDNRWCRISGIEHTGGDIKFVRFIATYGDGTKTVRDYPARMSWLVKIDSISDSMVVTSARYRNIYTIVATLAQASVPPPDYVDLYAEEITRQILKITTV